MRRLTIRPLALLSLLVPLLAASAAHAFEIQVVESKSGADAWLVEEHAVPIVAVKILFHGGSHLDPAGREGLADMTTALMTEGAGDLDSQAFAARLRELHVSLSVDAGRDSIGISLRTLKDNVGEAFELMRLALTEPRFDKASVARVRAQLLTGLARDEEDPETVASRAFFSQVFGEHAYAHSPSGTPESIKAITVADMRAFLKSTLARDTANVAVVGAISAEQLRPLLDETFAGLPAEAKIDDPGEAPAIAPGTAIIERDNPQSVIMFGSAGLKRHDPDFIPAYVMNYILGGGGFASRLTTEVRERRGLVYGIYTGLYPLDHGALFFGQFATANENAEGALALVRAELRRMAAEGVSDEELANAKTYLTGSYPLRFDTSRAIADQLAAIQSEDLGIEYVEKRNGMIEAVTQDDIARVAKRLLDPKALSIVIVGKPDGQFLAERAAN